MYKLILEKLKDKSIAILGFGREGKSTYNFLRKHFPEKELTIIDQKEIDIVIEEDGNLYPIEIKMSANPTKTMGKHFTVLDNIPGKKRQPGIILCQYNRKTYLTEDMIALPIEYI